MRLRLLLILLVAVAGLGADCGGSSHGSAAASSSATTFATTEGDDFVAPVPEPGAALVFGAGLLLAGVAIRRMR